MLDKGGTRGLDQKCRRELVGMLVSEKRGRACTPNHIFFHMEMMNTNT
jgi:hypothetical protein